MLPKVNKKCQIVKVGGQQASRYITTCQVAAKPWIELMTSEGPVKHVQAKSQNPNQPTQASFSTDFGNLQISQGCTSARSIRSARSILAKSGLVI